MKCCRKEDDVFYHTVTGLFRKHPLGFPNATLEEEEKYFFLRFFAIFNFFGISVMISITESNKGNRYGSIFIFSLFQNYNIWHVVISDDSLPVGTKLIPCSCSRLPAMSWAINYVPDHCHLQQLSFTFQSPSITIFSQDRVCLVWGPICPTTNWKPSVCHQIDV